MTAENSERLRNKITRLVCNFMIKHVAHDDYGKTLVLVIKQGMYYANTGEGPFIGKK